MRRLVLMNRNLLTIETEGIREQRTLRVTMAASMELLNQS